MRSLLTIIMVFFLSMMMVFYSFSGYADSFSFFPDIDVNEDGLVFISGIENRFIYVLSPYGQLINKISLPSNMKEVSYLSACPCGGYLLIADSSAGRAITLDDRSGKQLHHFSGIQFPGSVSVSSHSSRYMAVVDQRKNAVHLFTERGSSVREIPGGRNFNRADQVLLDRNNDLWVLDGAQKKIIRFDIRGNVMQTIQSSRNIPLQEPLDFDVDYQGRLYVLENNGDMLIFNSHGRVEESRNISELINAKPAKFSIDPKNNSLHFITSQGQHFHVSNTYSIESSIRSLGQEPVRQVVILRIGSRIMEHIGFDMMMLDEAPFIDPLTQRTMVPIRAIAEIFGAEVSWNASSRQVTLQHEEKTIILTIGSNVALIGGSQISMDAIPVIRNNRTFVPIRFVSETFGAGVQWIAESQRIVIAK